MIAEPDAIRFERFVERGEGCWLWKGYIAPNGYGKFHASETGEQSAHRASFRIFKGDIPEGFQIDHLCRTRNCVNPAHLEAVSHQENLFRSRKTHCHRGHPLSGPNLYVKYRSSDNTEARMCRACRLINDATYRAKRKTK